MNIVFVTPDFIKKNKPSTGLPNYLYRVAKILIEFGHNPIILTAGDVDENMFMEGIQVIRRNTQLNIDIKNETLQIFVKAMKMNFVLTRELKKLIRNKHIDIIQFSSLFGLGIFYFGKVPSILRLSSYAKLTYKSNQDFTKQSTKLMELLEKNASKHRNGIISPSEVMAKEYGKDVRRVVTVIESPFSMEDNLLDESIYKSILQNKKYVIYFGSFYEIKGLKVIAKMIYQFLKKHEELYFVFIGDIYGEIGNGLLKLLYQSAAEYKNRVIYIKALSHSQLYPCIIHSEVVVLPSLMENLSNACIEAMALRKIVVGTDGASYEQLIIDGESGFLAEINDPASLLRKIEEALALTSLEKDRIQTNAFNRIRLLNVRIIVKRLLKYYSAVINHKKIIKK